MVWHRRTRVDYLFARTKCCALFVSGRCTATIVAMVPVEKRLCAMLGRLRPVDNTDEFGEGISGGRRNTRCARRFGHGK